MSKTDFQNGFALGMASGGVVEVVPEELLATKQDALVSGENIKTINGQSILGEGDISISGGSDYTLPIGGEKLGGVKNGGNVVINEDGTMTAPASGGETLGSSVEPMHDDIPKVFFEGDIAGMTRDNEKILNFAYKSKTKQFDGYVKMKWQGSSSLSYPKKNFTIKMFSDETCETKLKKTFKDWNHESNKFVLKANWIDHSHARNIVSARIWDEVVKSRSNYEELPEEMRNSPQSGAIDGFPVKVYINGTYEGVYTWNIGKDDWMWGMDEDNPKHILLSCCYNDNGVLLEKAGNFRALWSGKHEDNWDIEVGSESDALTASLNALISCVKDTDDVTFKATIGNYLDINSALDYYLYFWANAGLDSLENNMLLATYDGVKWICGAYDMDSVWGLHYTGNSFIATNFKCPDQYQAPFSLLWERILKLFVSELKTRYAELRRGVLSYPNIVTHFERFMDVIGSELYAEDLTIYTGIPSGNTNNIKQIRNYVRDRLAYVDEKVNALGESSGDDSGETGDTVPCTSITLSASELSFTGYDKQTLTATVAPDGCTEPVIWESTDNTIASVKDGVVTSNGNGSTTIIAMCGAYSASCSVSVSGIVDGWNDGIFTVQLTEGKAINTEGNIVAYDAWAHENYIDVALYVPYKVIVPDDTEYIDVFGYDENKGYVQRIIYGGANGASTFFENTNANIKYIRIVVYGSNDASLISVIEINTVHTVSDNTIMTYKSNIDKSGAIRLHVTAYALITYYPVEANANYTINCGDNATYPGAHAYDSDFAYLGEISGTVDGGTTTFTTPESTAYLRWACLGTPTNPTTIVKN